MFWNLCRTLILIQCFVGHVVLLCTLCEIDCFASIHTRKQIATIYPKKTVFEGRLPARVQWYNLYTSAHMFALLLQYKLLGRKIPAISAAMTCLFVDHCALCDRSSTQPSSLKKEHWKLHQRDPRDTSSRWFKPWAFDRRWRSPTTSLISGHKLHKLKPKKVTNRRIASSIYTFDP